MSSGCGYSLAGRGSSLPATIRSVGIPLFENATPVFELEQLLTERVRLEFIGRGKYKVMPDAPGADAVLIGGITSVMITPTSFNSEQQATRYAFSMVVKVEFRDAATNRIIYENPALSFREEYEVAGNVTASTTSSPDANSFLGRTVKPRSAWRTISRARWSRRSSKRFRFHVLRRAGLHPPCLPERSAASRPTSSRASQRPSI